MIHIVTYRIVSLTMNNTIKKLMAKLRFISCLSCRYSTVVVSGDGQPNVVN